MKVVSVHAVEAYRDSRFLAPLILTSALDLVVFSFTLWPSYRWEKIPLTDEKEAGWTPEPVRTFFRGEISFPFAGIRTPYRPTCISLVSILITLPRLRIPNSCFFQREHTFPACFITCPVTTEMCVPPVQAMGVLLDHRTRWCVFGLF